MRYSLRCLGCGTRYPMYFRKQLCEKCGGILEVDYVGRPGIKELRKDFWGYEPLLPRGEYKHYKLGNTTLLPSVEEGLFLKLEMENPTRSFKDRGSVVEVAKALEYGYDEVVCASTGNMAYSVAYYAKLAGIRSTIFVSRNANWLKLRNIRETRDAKIFRVDGDFTEAQRRAIVYANRKEAFLVGDYGYRKEGQKTLIYEVLAELPEVRNVFIPVGNATLFSAACKGIAELKRYGLSKASPRLVAVQASLTDPLAVAFKTGKHVRYQKPLTDAGAIAVGYPTYGDEAVAGVKATGGTVVDVTDKEMEEERKAFYREYGLQVEMSGVASVAAFRKVSFEGRSVAIVSGANTLKP
ncbi:MAG TPA: pyridoxal-phosphate dependent enzyme [Nitrososphaerales archaeon]|nr:pyridoxal-phosphate dependent enzyme [Nitrososphaerales archaeon]